MATLVFTDGTSIEFGRAEADSVPQRGHEVYLDFGMKSALHGQMYAFFRVERVTWDVKNISQVEAWMSPYPRGSRTMVILTVSALNAETQAFMDRVRQAGMDNNEQRESE